MSAESPWRPEPVRIARRRRETDDTFTLELELEAAPAFRPGQFNMLYLFGVGEVAISISGDPERRGALVHTIRAVGTVTKALSRVRAGDVLGVRGPYGSPWAIDQAAGRHLLLVAGGLGIAPLRPVVYHALRHRDRFDRVTLLYGSRSPDDVVFRSEVERWARRKDIEVETTVDHAGTAWSGRVGVVTALIDALPLDPARTVAFLCGPEVMMRFAARALAARGVAADGVWVSMERNMKCAVGLCGRCQYRESFVCKDGPVLRLDRIAEIFERREV
jgi:NAD(P)H-flavin reductase